MNRVLLIIGALPLLFPATSSAAVIGQVTGTSINPTTNGGWMDYVTGIAPGEAPPLGTGLSITVGAAILDVDDSYNSYGSIRYRIGGSIPGPTPDPGIATFNVTLENQDPSTDPADYLTQFRLRIFDNYSPGVTISSPTQPGTFSLVTSSPSELLWQSPSGVGPGAYNFSFLMAIPRSTAGNTFGMELLARNGTPTTASTPEPGSIALAGITIAMLGGGAMVRRRRRKKRTDVPCAD